MKKQLILIILLLSILAPMHKTKTGCYSTAAVAGAGVGAGVGGLFIGYLIGKRAKNNHKKTTTQKPQKTKAKKAIKSKKIKKAAAPIVVRT